MSQSRVAVLVLNWNGWADSVACIESLLRLNGDVGVILCDNASSDGSTEHVRDWAKTGLAAVNSERLAKGRAEFRFLEAEPPPVHWPIADSPSTDGGVGTITFIQTGANLGFAGGNNVGLRLALAQGYDHFWILNNDTRVLSDTLERGLERMAADSGIGICGSTLVYLERPEMVQCLAGGTFNDWKGRGALIGLGQPSSAPIDGAAVEAQLRFVNGAAMLVSRAFLEQIGLMYEGYFLYCEELDWARCARGRFKLGYAPDAVVLHRVGASIGTRDFGESSPLSEYYLVRSRVKYCLRHAWQALPFTTLDIARQVLRLALKGRWDRAGLFVRAALGLSYKRPAGA